jgi:hypothetical protein
MTVKAASTRAQATARKARDRLPSAYCFVPTSSSHPAVRRNKQMNNRARGSSDGATPARAAVYERKSLFLRKVAFDVTRSSLTPTFRSLANFFLTK